MAGTTPVLGIHTYSIGDSSAGYSQMSQIAQDIEDRACRYAAGPVNTSTTVAGTNNFDATAAIVIPSRTWPRVLWFAGNITTVMSGAGATSPTLRIQDNFNTRASTPLVNAPNSGGVGSVSGYAILAAGVTASYKLNVDVPSGWSVTPFSGAGAIFVIAFEGLGAM